MTLLAEGNAMTDYKPTITKVLLGHTSPETAYLVEDYPYGFTLRCQIRYWLEYKPNHGFRFVSQTTNPKRGNVWNKPKASTYVENAAFMFLDENGHVQWHGLGIYNDAAEAQAFLDEYRDAINPEWLPVAERWVTIKTKYEQIRNEKRQQANQEVFQAETEAAIQSVTQ